MIGQGNRLFDSLVWFTHLLVVTLGKTVVKSEILREVLSCYIYTVRPRATTNLV